MTNKTYRTALTKNGTEVILNKCYPVDGGWISWVIGNSDYAVQIFVPAK